jgi:hypothetical protein
MTPRQLRRGQCLGPLAFALLLIGLQGCTERPDFSPDGSFVENDTGGDIAFDGAGDLGGDELPVPCEADETRCYEGSLATCIAGGSGWLVEACDDGLTCSEGACLDLECEPGARACDDDGGVLSCSADGAEWLGPAPCDEGTGCFDGACIPQICEPGDVLCATASVLTCAEDGASWESEACDEGSTCYLGRCITCFDDGDCDGGLACVDGACAEAPLHVATERLTDAASGSPYAFTLEAGGGEPPYTWEDVEEELPSWLSLSPEGVLSGTPDATGEHTFTVGVIDTAGDGALADFTLTVRGAGLTITTETLPAAEEGFEYSASLEAVGGAQPYAWLIVDGTLPAGVTMTAAGDLIGTPSAVGDFPFTVRAFDAALPPAIAEAELTLTVELAPLEIVGDQEFNLIITKVITLPLMTVVDGIPIPYSTTLTARGGLRPYHWAETELPAGVSALLPGAGLPDGLTLAEDGTVSGSVTSTGDVISLEVPFTGIVLNGFFFTAEVRDSQASPESRSALFLIPTLPIGG